MHSLTLTELSATEIQLNPEHLDRFRLEVSEAVVGWTDKRLLAALGYLNSLIYCSAKDQGVVERDNSNQLSIHECGALRRLRGKLSVTVPNTFVSTFLSRFWSGAINSLGSIRIIRDVFANVFNLFTIEQQLPKARWKYQPNEPMQRATYHDFDVMRALLVYEQLERVWCDRRQSLDALPSHKGVFCKMLYDVLFSRSLGFGRKGDSAAGKIPPTKEEAAMLRAEMALKTRDDRQTEYHILSAVVKEWQAMGMQWKCPALFGDLMGRMLKAKDWLIKGRWTDEDFAEVPY